MQHISTILRAEGFIVDRRTQVVGIDSAETYEHMGASVSDEALVDVGDRAWVQAGDDWETPRGVVVNPSTGLIEKIVLLDPRCDFVPTDQLEA